MFIIAGIQFKHGKKSFVCGLPTSLFVALLRFRKTVNGPFGRNFGVTLGPPLGLSAFQADELAGNGEIQNILEHNIGSVYLVAGPNR